MVVKRFVAGTIAVSAFGLSACSNTPSGPPPPYLVYPSPSASATPKASPIATGAATASATPASTPSASPPPANATPAVSPSPTPPADGTPGPTSTPTPVPTAVPAITGSLASITVCVEQQMTCADDLDADATSGEGAAVFVKGVLGTLSYSNAGGPAVGTVTAQVYATSGDTTEYEVFYTSASASATSDTLTIADSGSHSSLTIPVSIINVGSDTGASAFRLTTTSGSPCPGQQMSFATQQQGNATISLVSSNTSVVSTSPNVQGNFALGILEPGTGYVTATAGSSTVIYPIDIPSTGFTSNC